MVLCWFGRIFLNSKGCDDGIGGVGDGLVGDFCVRWVIDLEVFGLLLIEVCGLFIWFVNDCGLFEMWFFVIVLNLLECGFVVEFVYEFVVFCVLLFCKLV